MIFEVILSSLLEQWNKTKIFPKGTYRTDHISYAYEHCTLEGEVVEFGFRGGTGRHIAKLCGQTVHGFDSFAGLPEPWDQGNVVEQFRFKMDKPPEMPDSYKIHIGLFADTIPVWKETHKDQIKFLHIDSDIYSSCVTVLTELNAQIVPGTVIVFDDMFGSKSVYPKWQEGEWKALNEWLKDFNREIKPIARRYIRAASCIVVK
jgi:hypothetical protein